MPVCPRCKHPAERADIICTQCGSVVPAETEVRAPTSVAKILLVFVLLVHPPDACVGVQSMRGGLWQ